MGTILLFVIGIFVILAVAAFALQFFFGGSSDDEEDTSFGEVSETDEDIPTPKF